MQIRSRRILSAVQGDLLDRKMVFISGPRQSGKTTLARTIIGDAGSYFTWDSSADRKKLQNQTFSDDAGSWVFDEIHKYARWRNWLKGIYDLYGSKHGIIVTGSAKLNLFSRGGDSLQGRYFHHRLHPLTVGELLQSNLPSARTFKRDMFLNDPKKTKASSEALQQLLVYGGFPEPFLKSSHTFSKRWARVYGERLIREDIRDLYRFPDLASLELLFERLPDTVGSSLTYAKLARDLEVSFESIKRWVDAFEDLYGVFRVPPYGPPKIRAVKQEQKLYFWDWSRVSNPGGRLENLVALHLLRLCHWCADSLGENVELRYFRDATGREVDFILLWDRKPWCCVEVKSSEQPVEPSLQYLVSRMEVEHAFQVTLKSKEEVVPHKVAKTQIRRLPLDRFLSMLP